jgi:hypothetical protein
MAYLIQGNAQKLMHVFGQEQRIAEGSGVNLDSQQMSQDLLRTKFLGTEQDAHYFLNTLRAAAKGGYYLPGTASASNLFSLLGLSKPFIIENESPEDERSNYIQLHFAYVNEKQELCTLMLLFRRDDPTQWTLGLVKNSHLEPKDSTAVILSGFDLGSYVKSGKQEFVVTSVDSLINPLMEQIGSPFILSLLQNIFKVDTGEVNNRAERITQLLRTVQELDKTSEFLFDPINLSQISPEQLFAENPALDKIIKYKLRLSSALLKECLKKDSGLQKEIAAIRFSDDVHINQNLLKMVIVFYEQQVLIQNRDFLQKQVFEKTMGGLLLNNAQINLIPFLVKNKYSLDLFDLILSKEAYYDTVHILVQFGYTEDLPHLFTDSEKLSELNYINSITDPDIRKVCLIFWTKSALNSEEYKKIVKATSDYPMLAKTLLELDKRDRPHIENLKNIALNPKEHQIESILYHFKPQLGRTGKLDLKRLSANGLFSLTQSFNVLKNAGITSSDLYMPVLNKTKQGKLLRLFLPGFEKIDNVAYRQELIRILFIGIKTGPVSLEKAILEITDKKLLILARNLHERFICVKQMQDLDSNKEMIALAAEEWGIHGIRFRKIILRVEEQCKNVHEQIRGSVADKEKAVQWQNVDKEYRRTLYSIAFDGLKNTGVDIKAKLSAVETKILNIIDPEIKSWIYNVFVILANIIITGLTLSIANNIKEKRTGNYWFFNQTQLGEEVRALDKEVLDVINSPEPDPALTF